MHFLPRVVRSKSKIILQFDHGPADPRHVHQVIFMTEEPIRRATKRCSDKHRWLTIQRREKGLRISGMETAVEATLCRILFKSIIVGQVCHLLEGLLTFDSVRVREQRSGLMVLIPIFAQPVMSMKIFLPQTTCSPLGGRLQSIPSDFGGIRRS